MQLTRNDGIWAAAIAGIWILAGADLVSPRMQPGNVAVFWLPNAVLAVAMLRRLQHPRIVALFALAAAAGAVIPGALRTGEGAPGWALLAVANAVESYALAWVAQRFGGPGVFTFHRPRNVALWAGAALGASTLSMLMAWAASNAGMAPVDFTNAPAAGLNWVLGDACAHLTLGAFLVAVTSPNAKAQTARLRRERTRAAAMAVLIVATGVVGFAGPRLWDVNAIGAHPGYLGLVLPVLMWAAFRYGPAAAAAASVMALTPGVAFSVNGFGPFGLADAWTAHDLQILILAIAATTLLVGVLGAALRENRDRVAADDRSKTLFLSRIGHELRTPLNGVIGAADLLARDLAEAPDAQQDRLDLVRSSARMLASVVEDLVEYAAVHREGVTIRPSAFEARRPFEDAAAIFEPRAHWNAVSFALQLKGFDDLWIVTDPMRLRQVLFAVVANAVEATVEGSIVVEAEARAEPGGDRVRIDVFVRDTGPGIPTEAHERIFEPFAQVQEDRNRPSPGLGLGLAVAKDMLNALGGTIALESEPGAGAAFHISFTAARASAPAEMSGGDGRAPRALLAEDNPMNRMVLSAMLSALGFDVVGVETGAEALEAAQRSDFHLIVMDIQMPVMDGEEATERIRALEGRRSRTPIVVVTGHSLAGDDKRYAAAGADKVLQKPIDVATLSRAVAELLGEKGSG